MDLVTGQSLLQPGALIGGRYEVQRALGTGGMGTVLLVLDRALDNEPVALKLLFPHLAQDKTTFARFRNEVIIARRLSHPNIVRLYDIGNAGAGYFFISMEFVSGGSLTKKIYEHRHDLLSFNETLRILRQIALGIGHAHRTGVVHRDLKPDNVLLTEREDVKITDFGLARTLYVDKGFTDTGEAVGTPYYMAPEQLRGEKVDGRCDIYALGLIAFEMVVGRRPFFEESYLELAHMHLRAPIPTFATKESGIPKWYEDFVNRCSAKSPDDRYQSADEIVDFLEEKLEAMQGKQARMKRRPAILSFSQRHSERRRMGWKTISVTILLMAMAIGAVAAAVSRSPELRGKLLGAFHAVAGYFGAGANDAQLFDAIERGDIENARMLVAAGANPNAENFQARPALLHALHLGRIDIARLLLESGADPNGGDPVTKVTPLMTAVRNPEAAVIVQDLLRRGADPDDRSKDLRTALIYASEAGNTDAVKLLLDQNAVLGARDNQGLNALMHAIRSSQTEVVELLLLKKIDLESTDIDGKTAIFYAVIRPEDDITRLLLRAGASATAVDKAGRLPLDYASTKNRKTLRALLRNEEP